MGSLIEAIIYDGGSRPEALPGGLPTVPLASGLTMLPVTDELFAMLDPRAMGDERISSNWVLQQPVAALARRMSAGRRALYIFGETAGGPGTQEAIGWQDGQLCYGPSGTCDIEIDLEPGYHLVPRPDSAINTGLRAMGVLAAGDQDEYQTVGLTRHRMTQDWLQK